MKKDINVAFGDPMFTIPDLKDVTHRVTQFASEPNNMVRMTIQKGNEVDVVTLSIETLKEIGFLNFNALKPFCK